MQYTHTSRLTSRRSRDLIQVKVLEQGNKVFCIKREDKLYYGDLTADGRIRFSKGNTPPSPNLFFDSPTAFLTHCGSFPFFLFEVFLAPSPRLDMT